jgi:hypothetical protein
LIAFQKTLVLFLAQQNESQFYFAALLVDFLKPEGFGLGPFGDEFFQHTGSESCFSHLVD